MRILGQSIGKSLRNYWEKSDFELSENLQNGPCLTRNISGFEAAKYRLARIYHTLN